MADEPSKTPGIPAEHPSPQMIPLSKIHDLPGMFIQKQPDKNYGGLVSSIQASGVKEPVILRLREDGEYQLVAGYRRRRACELAKFKEIPAYVYEMTMKEAREYHAQVNNKPSIPIPGKLLNVPSKTQTAPKGDRAPEAEKTPEQPAPGAPGKKGEEPAPQAEQTAPKEGKAPEAEKKPEQPVPAAPGKKGEEPAPQAEQAAPKEGKAPEAEKKPEQPVSAAPGKKGEEPAPQVEQAAPKESKAPEAEKKPEQPFPATPGKKAVEPAPQAEQAAPKEGKAPEAEKKAEQPAPAAPGKKDEKPAPQVEQAAPKEGKAPEAEKKPEQPAPAPGKKDEKPAPQAEQAAPKADKAPEGKKKSEPAVKTDSIAAKGPAGTQITQVFEDRLSPPDEKALKDLPNPKEGESFFIVLHPGYLEKSKFNTVSVDRNSEDYRELKKSIELNGVKDPVLTRINPEGGLEIISGQRRHLIATELNYPVPAIIQKIDDADAKILVSDGNLHRPKISTYDLSRTLRLKMEGMKQKAGRRKKGAPTAEELNSDEKLAQEMGMSVSKLNRIIRLSEATQGVCARVDDGSLALSIASAVSFLKPDNQDEVLHLMDLGYRVSTERVEYLKKVEKAGKLNEGSMRQVLEGENVLDPPKVIPYPQPPAETPAEKQPGQEPSVTDEPVLPPSPDMKPPAEQPTPTPPAEEPPAQTPPVPPATEAPVPAKEQDESKGEQERPEHTKIILTGDRLRKYFPDVSMTPREIEESIYDALEERRQRLEKQKQKEAIFKKNGPTR